MEVQSLQREVVRLRTEKEALAIKSKLFENFAAMAHSCCRTPNAAEWKELRDTLSKTVEFSIELTQAESGCLSLHDGSGGVSESICQSASNGRNDDFSVLDQRPDKGLTDWVMTHKKIGLVSDSRYDDRWAGSENLAQNVRSALAVPVHKGPE